MAAGQLRHAVAARCATNSNLAVADYARERKLDASVGHQFGSAHDADDTITQLVGCAVPIQQAGMGAASPPELAAAVSEAGGLGMLGTARAGLNMSTLAALLGQTRQLTSRPFGVNLRSVTSSGSRLRVLRVRTSPNSSMQGCRRCFSTSAFTSPSA